jgi:hypothetical protein
MPSDPSAEQRVLLGALNRQREHVLKAVEGLASNDLRRQVLPSAWSCIGLVNHLSLDVERFWFQAVTAGNQIAIEDVLASSDNAWNVSDEEPVEEVLHRYRANIDHADGIIAGRSPLMQHRRGGPISSAPGGLTACARSCSTSWRRPPPTPVTLMPHVS